MASKRQLAIAAKAEVEKKQNFLEKLASSMVIKVLEREFFEAKVGKKIFGGKGIIFDAGPTAIGIKIKFSDTFDYKFTIERMG